MKLIFEGKILKDIIQEMEDVLAVIAERKVEAADVAAAAVAAAAKKQLKADMGAGIVQPIRPTPPVVKPVDKPVEDYAALLRKDLDRAPIEKPVEKKERTEKQKANDARLRERAKENPFGRKTVKAAAPVQPERVMPPPPKTAEGMDPAEVARNRLRTISELQEAYANGHQKEVFELLSRFGNGAKSFRELPPESFVPIREAIDNGGLT